MIPESPLPLNPSAVTVVMNALQRISLAVNAEHANEPVSECDIHSVLAALINEVENSKMPVAASNNVQLPKNDVLTESL